MAGHESIVKSYKEDMGTRCGRNGLFASWLTQKPLKISKWSPTPQSVDIDHLEPFKHFTGSN